MEPSVPTQHSHGDTQPAKPHERRHAVQGTGTPTDTQHTQAHATERTSLLGARGGDMLGPLPMLCGTERAQAQVPAACLWVGDPQAAEAGCGINGEQEAGQRLCGPEELWMSRARCCPLPCTKLEQGQSTLCQTPGPHAPMVSAASPHPASCQTQGCDPMDMAGWTCTAQPTCLTGDRGVVTGCQWDFMV